MPGTGESVGRWYRRRLAALLAAATFVGLSSQALSAQATISELGRQATRGELETAAQALETASASAPDSRTRERLLANATAIRQRLASGDFIPGDRILLQVIGDSARSDTFTVRVDRMLHMPDIPAIPLHGVLDSELEPYLTKELSKYIKEVELQATVLLRLMVSGAVGNPGFITVPVDQALPDVITTAGGYAGTADWSKTEVRRAGKTFLQRAAMRDAVRLGKTVGDVALRDGDEIFVPAQPQGGPQWQTIITGVGTVMGIYWALRWGRRGGRP